MRIVYNIFFASLVVLLFLLPVQQTFHCDYHNATFFKSGREYPNGHCYDVYTHPYWINGQRYIHKMVTPCE